MKNSRIRVVLVDDHEVVRAGLRALLADETDLDVVGEAGTAAEAIAVAKQLDPHVVLLDVRLPDTSGIEVCRTLLELQPGLRIVALTSADDRASMLAMVRAGAHGYLLKTVHIDELIHAIVTVAKGQSYVDSHFCGDLLSWIRDKSGARSTPLLSRQELQILPLLAEGKTNKEIGGQLNLSDKTVKNYLSNIYDKLHVHRRSEVVAWYVRESLSSLVKL